MFYMLCLFWQSLCIFQGYPHNTYHGPAKHFRPHLNNLAIVEREPQPQPQPMWFTDSPQHSQHFATAVKPSPPPSHRRKTSCTSIEPVEVKLYLFCSNFRTVCSKLKLFTLVNYSLFCEKGSGYNRIPLIGLENLFLLKLSWKCP